MRKDGGGGTLPSGMKELPARPFEPLDQAALEVLNGRLEEPRDDARDASREFG